MILTRNNWIIVILSTIVFFPVSYYLFKSSSDAQRTMHLIVFLQSLVLYSFNLKIYKNSRKLFFLFFLFSISFVFFLINYIKTLTFFSLNDLSDIFRIVFIYNYIVLGYVISKSLNFEILISYLKKLFKIQIISSLLIFIPPLYFLLDIFKGRPSYEEFNFHFYRTSGTFIYPSDFSFVIGFFVFYFLYQFVFKNKCKLSLLISLILVFSSISRGAILSYGLFIPLIPLIFYKNIFSFSKLIYPSYLILFFISFVSLLYFNNEYLDYIVDSASYIITGEGSIDSSTSHRFNELTLAFNYANDNFPFGLGPSRSLIYEKIDVIESFYAYYLIKWGYIGLSFMLIFYFYILYIMFKRYNYFRGQSNFSVAGLYFSFISLTISFLLFFGWSSAITERFKLMPFYFILCGFLIGSNKSR
jgi:hypothetical protein